jgi:hypothetical protein
MRIAFVHSYNSQPIPQTKELFLSVPNIEFSEYFFDGKKLLNAQGTHVTLQDIAIENDAYLLDSHIPAQIQENIHHYFDMHGGVHVFGKTYEKKDAPHDFLLAKSMNVQAGHADLERALVTLWTGIPHPIRVRKEQKISEEISSIHELRRHALPALSQGENIECVYQPKGRKLTCTLVRNARGKKVYTTPLFEKITHPSGSKLSSSSLSHEVKENIIAKLETLFSHYPTFPTLHVELTHTPKGLYLMHAAPLQDFTKEIIPDTLHAIGMVPRELLAACLASLSTK